MRKLLLVVAIVVAAVPATAAAAWARTYLVLKHPSSDPGTLLYQPRNLELKARFHWLPDPGSNHVERQESKALSGNLSGTFEPQC